MMPMQRMLGRSCLLLMLAGCTYYEPPGGKFQKLSQIARFPDFYPGLGTLYVQPDTMPIGPYYSYDRRGRLVNTIYMVPMRFFDEHQVVNMIQGSPRPVDHAVIAYTAPHPGVDEPHYHIILWHVSAAEAAKVQ
jgi:hypothetical protein